MILKTFTHAVQIWIKHGHDVAPKLFYHEFLQRNYMKMTMNGIFRNNSFIQLILYEIRLKSSQPHIEKKTEKLDSLTNNYNYTHKSYFACLI